MVRLSSTLLFVVMALGLTSCGPTTTVKTQPDTPVETDRESTAIEYLKQRQYSSAAREYQQLATDYPELANGYRLKAATAWFEDGNDLQAEKSLNETDIDVEVFPLQHLQKIILLAKLANYRQQASSALELLSDSPGINTPDGLLTAYHQTRAEAYRQLEQPNSYLVEMLSAFSAAANQTTTAAEVDTFWSVLKTRSTTELDSIRMMDTPTSNSWLSLADIAKQHLTDRQALELALSNWQQEHPNHPASLSIVPELISNAERYTLIQPKQIALILPLSNRYQKAGQAIRDGFVSGWMEFSVSKPELKIYDSTTGNINQIYQQAVDQGADLVVGPLLRDNIIDLLNNDNLMVNTLLLNYLAAEQIPQNDTVLPGVNLFQVGLSPEQEARQIAQQAYADGHSSALVLTPANNKGQSILDSFQQEFESLGGQVLEYTSFDNSSNSYIQNIRAILNSDISKQRAADLRATINLTIESETRSRQDADMLFLHARNLAAKQIVPMLYFEQQNRIPIYATSDIHTKSGADEDNTDINNVTFVDIPWLLSNSVMAENIRNQFQQHWPGADYFLYRLYALGNDTYRIIDNLANMRSNPNMNLQGLSGTLLLNKTGEIQRQLTLGIFQEGQAQAK